MNALALLLGAPGREAERIGLVRRGCTERSQADGALCDAIADIDEARRAGHELALDDAIAEAKRVVQEGWNRC